MLLTVPATPIGESLTLQTFRAEDAAALPGPEWLRERRLASQAAFASTALPTESEEVWRYSPIDELDLDQFAPATTPARKKTSNATRLIITRESGRVASE